MTHAQFYEFCLPNRGLRIERTASGAVVIMPFAFSDTGNHNFNIAAHSGTGSSRMGQASASTPVQALPCRMVRPAHLMPPGFRLERWNVLTESQKASFATICPNFVIELCSSSVRKAPPKEITLTSLQDKLQEYMTNGAVLGWLIDRSQKSHGAYLSP